MLYSMLVYITVTHYTYSYSQGVEVVRIGDSVGISDGDRLADREG